MDRFVGTGVALVTPFDENLEVDKVSLTRLVNHVIEGGVDFLVVLGTTGETVTLSFEEKREVVRLVHEVDGGRVPIMIGLGGNNTAELVREMRSADWLQYGQAILSITPFYNKPSQEGLYRHFKALAEVSPLPLCLYNVPGRTGVNLAADTLMRLSADCPRIIAVKEASGKLDQAAEILKRRKKGFIALSGDDSLVLPLVSMGFDGVISVVANLMPAKCSALVESVKRGDLKMARECHIALADICRMLFEEGNPSGVKAALHAAGIIRCNTLRLPLCPVSPDLYARIKEAEFHLSDHSI